MCRDRKGPCWNTGLGSQKSIWPSSLYRVRFPTGGDRRIAACSLPHPFWGFSGPSLALLQASKGTLVKAFCSPLHLQSWTLRCPHFSRPYPFSSQVFTLQVPSLSVLAESFFRHTPEMEFVPSGSNSIIFCQNLVLKITAAENYQSTPSSRKTQFSSQERNLSFPFSSKYLKCFILSKRS